LTPDRAACLIPDHTDHREKAMSDNATVTVHHLERPPAVRLVWMSGVDGSDLRAALGDLAAHLDDSEQPHYVIMDIRRDPRFPLADTVLDALVGPFRHEKLLEWLIVGDSPAAREAECELQRLTGQGGLRWFDTHYDTLAYLNRQSQPGEAVLL
jgi:hypothetical protein